MVPEIRPEISKNIRKIFEKNRHFREKKFSSAQIFLKTVQNSRSGIFRKKNEDFQITTCFPKGKKKRFSEIPGLKKRLFFCGDMLETLKFSGFFMIFKL